MTPTEIKAAHPKCGTCEHYDQEKKFENWDGTVEQCEYCNYYHIVVTQGFYCQDHTELTNQQKETNR